MATDVIFDLETIPDQREGVFDTYLDAVEPPGNYKKQETIDTWLFENAERIALENFRKTALNGLHGEICSIAWSIMGDEPQSLTRDPTMPEKELIEKFFRALEYGIEKHFADAGLQRTYRSSSVCWIGHNVLDFDLRFLKQRCLVNGIRPPFTIPADARHPSDLAYDTMREWAGFRGYVKLDELVDAFGIGLPDWADVEDVNQVDGSKVWELYRNGDYDLIAQYNKLDVWKTYQVYKRMTGR